ncbi:cyclin-domain-containing protein [Absidia repens]|uniref:Cyclin-domain-containing protein n=1 Tax=Absidia repens TaxID=90262 RepID=A0A1X2IPT6_9FUNG|nr:cyclin-domain-containing protein [Absidia repens]
MATSIDTSKQTTSTLTSIQVPEYFYAVDINYLTHMIADMLERLISHNDLIPLTSSNLTRFHSRIPPNITLSDYLRRIIKFTSIEKSCLLIILIYIDRVCERHPQFTISSLTVHRFLITAVTLSAKALSDSYCTNSHYARIGGISTQELNALELEFLTLIDWRLTSTGVILQQYYANLVEQHPCYQRIIIDPLPPLTTATVTGVDHRNQHNTILPTLNATRKRRRRRSSAKSTISSLSEGSGDVGLKLDEMGHVRDITDNDNDSMDNNEGNNNTDDDDDTIDTAQDEIEARRIWAHFDQLSDTDWIPYIA